MFILAVTVCAAVIRLPCLMQRPMHCDEAVHAEKFAALLEDGLYSYDPDEYHGPTLNYLTLIPAWLGGERSYCEIDETTLRVVPVFFGVLLVLLIVPVWRGLGLWGAGIAAVLTAISPAMIYYSRYYIQEMLLVCFTFGAIVSCYRYSRGPSFLWAVLAGVFFGLMHATKETCVIAFASMFGAYVLMRILRRRDNKLSCAEPTKVAVKAWHIIAAIAAGFLISGLFFSSFTTNPRGILDSFLTYTNYLHRAGQNPLHIHPWYFYLEMLLYSRFGDGPIWSEALIVVLAVVGAIVSLRKKTSLEADRNLVRFIAAYTVLMIVGYSVIPYKTPWCMLGFLHGMILLAGVGGAWLIRRASGGGVGIAVGVWLMLAIGGGHLLWQGYQGSYKYHADICNPYVYAHTSTDVYEIVRKVKEVAAAHPKGDDIPVQVFFPENYWPLPWYFRGLKVGYYKEVPDDALPAPIILASESVEPGLADMLYNRRPPGQRELYIYLFDTPSYCLELRPQVKLYGYVAKDLWEEWQRNRK